MRLLDRLLSFGFKHTLKQFELESVQRVLSLAQLVVVDNVAQYYWLRVKEGPKDRLPDASDFPNVMLPFETTFIELKFPRVQSIFERIESAGILTQMRQKGTLQSYWYNDANAADFFAPDVEWHMEGLVFFQIKGVEPMIVSRFAMPVTKDGRVLPSRKGGLYYSLQYLMDWPGMSEQENHDTHVACFQTAVMPALLALSFMHCRNVKVRTEQPPPKLSKKYQKRSGRPLLKYRVLMIDHMKQVLESEGKASTEGLKKALHICRGHFKTYGKDGKGLLFGKHAGTVWIPMHTRGNIEEGAVVKDYSVK